MKKNIVKMIFAAFIITVLFGMTAYAGTWKSDKNGWWYQNDDGSYPTNGWHWIADTNDPSLQKCYYFNANGYMHAGPTTPDGYSVNGNGEWVIDGVVQTKQSVAQTASPIVLGPGKSELMVGGEQVTLTIEVDKVTGLYKGVMKRNGYADVKYYLSVPKNATENMPMVIYLHSGGTMKLREQKREHKITGELGYIMSAGEEKIPAFVLIPYIDYEDKRYESSVHKIYQLVQAVAQEYKVDRNRISALGISSGGSGVVLLAHHYTDLLSAIVSVSPPYPEGQELQEKYISTVSQTPLWYIFEEIGWEHDIIEQSVQKLRDAGGSVWKTILAGKEHNNMDIFQGNQKDQFGIFDWLISMSK